MGFLDNSGDIILDAVLTDAGRARLARGDCSFDIAKFALADDEIDYSLYNKLHAQGNQYFDLEILQTPVLEAFTNNTSLMNSRLVTMPNNDEYYMPVIKLKQDGDFGMHSILNTFVVAVDKATMEFFQNANQGGPTTAHPGATGILNGWKPTEGTDARGIRADQGIDNTERGPENPLPGYLTETAYFLQMDNRFGVPVLPNTGDSQGSYSYLDDDQIASYYWDLPGAAQTAGLGGVDEASNRYVANIQDPSTAGSPIAGERGTRVHFRIKSSMGLEANQALFERVGTQCDGCQNITSQGQTLTTYWYIDSTVRLTGVTTGYRIDIPVKYVRKY